VTNKSKVLNILVLALSLSSCQAQYTGPEASTLSTTSHLIDRTMLEGLLHAEPPEMLLQAGDVLEVDAFELPLYKFQQRISKEGTIVAPLIGPLQVGGLTVQQAQARMVASLRDGGMIKDPIITVNVVSRPSAVITVSGAVARPGVFPATGNLTISDYLGMAGGLNGTSGESTAGAPASSVVTLVRRSLSVPVEVPLGPKANSSPYGRIPVFAGDEIRVGKLGSVYTIGALHTQGAITLNGSSATTVLNVISIAGGVGYQAKPKEAYIIRVSGDQKIVVNVPLKAILTGKAPDIAMQDQDILMIPTSQIKAAIKGGGAALIVSVASALIYNRTI